MEEVYRKHKPAEFAWSGIAEFYKRLAIACDLKDINMGTIWSVSVRRGLAREVRRKQNTLALLRQNIDSIEVCINGQDAINLTSHERDCANSLVINYRWYIGMLEEQLADLTSIQTWQQQELFDISDQDDQPPF